MIMVTLPHLRHLADAVAALCVEMIVNRGLTSAPSPT
jgi:hypothetical protein